SDRLFGNQDQTAQPEGEAPIHTLLTFLISWALSQGTDCNKLSLDMVKEFHERFRLYGTGPIKGIPEPQKMQQDGKVQGTRKRSGGHHRKQWSSGFFVDIGPGPEIQDRGPGSGTSDPCPIPGGIRVLQSGR